MKYVITIAVILFAILTYSLCVISKRADEQAERMYREWKESKDDEMD